MQDAQEQLLKAQSNAARVAKAKAKMEIETLRISQRIEILNNISTQATLLAGSGIAALAGESLETLDENPHLITVIGNLVYVCSGALATVCSLWVIYISSHLIAATRDASLRPNIVEASLLLEETLKEVRGMHMFAMGFLLLCCLAGTFLNMSLFTASFVLVIFSTFCCQAGRSHLTIPRPKLNPSLLYHGLSHTDPYHTYRCDPAQACTIPIPISSIPTPHHCWPLRPVTFQRNLSGLSPLALRLPRAPPRLSSFQGFLKQQSISFAFKDRTDLNPSNISSGSPSEILRQFGQPFCSENRKRVLNYYWDRARPAEECSNHPSVPSPTVPPSHALDGRGVGIGRGGSNGGSNGGSSDGGVGKSASKKHVRIATGTAQQDAPKGEVLASHATPEGHYHQLQSDDDGDEDRDRKSPRGT
jgi:uncharacterized membrane protein YgcG